MRRERLKLRPHYFWIGGIFVVGGLITSLVVSRPDTSETYAAEKTIADISTMQEMTPEICAKMPVTPTGTAATVSLKDSRDGNSYYIAKLADGNCWMVSNLKITNKTITSADSDLPSGASFTIPASSNKSDFKSDNKLTEQVYVSTSSETPANITYYNWYTATAGSGDGKVESDGAVVTKSICPKGWELPTGGSSGQFQGLATAIGDTTTSTWRGNPYNFAATGRVSDGSLNSPSSSYYWSRTAKSADSAYRLYMSSSAVYPADNDYRYYGVAVRCVAKNALETAIEEAGVTTMQDFGAGVCAKGNDGDTAYLTDARDGKQYRIAKLKNATDDDANCWMTSNLAFDIKNKSDQMTTALSDVTVDKTDWASNNVTINLGTYTDGTTGNAAAVYTNAKPTVGSTASSYKPEYGYYYSWCAATAGSCSDSTDDDGIAGKRSASQSICPKGWKLPTGGKGGEYQAMLGSSSWSTVNAGTKYNFYPAGYMISSGAIYIGSDARYWSSTSNSDTDAYFFNYGSSTVNPAFYSSRYFGLSVRCVVSNQKDSGQANFSVVVDDAITLVGAEFYNNEGGNTIHGIPGSVAEGKISVEVGSNVNYKITMRADEPDLTASKLDNASVIPTISNTVSNTPVTSTLAGLRDLSGWAVKPTSSDLYLGLLATDQTFYTSTTTAGASTITDFPVGVGLSPTLLPDTYSTTVTITAIANP